MPAWPRWFPACPATDPAPSLMIVKGALADVVEDQFARLFAQLGMRVTFFPAAPRQRAAGRRPADPLPAGAALPGRDGAPAGGPRRPAARRPFPLGVEGTTAWLRAAADAFGIAPPQFEATTAPARTRAQAALARQRPLLAGKRIFFFPDSQLEIPLARFLALEMGMELVEVGTPYLHRQHLAPELALLPAGTALSEGQDVDRQLDRCRAAAPDIVVCGLGLANPLEAQGLTTKWAIELVSPMPGYDQAADLARALQPAAGAPAAAGRLRHRPCSSPSGLTKAPRMWAPCASPRR